MKTIFNKSTLVMLCICLVFTIISGSINPKKANAINNEYGFELVQKTEHIVKVKGTHNGDELYATLNKDTSEITMEAIEHPKNLLKVGADKTTNYIVDVKDLDPTKGLVDLVIKDKDSKKQLKISHDVVQAQLPILIGVVVWGGEALLAYLLAHAVSIVIAGVIAYSISELLENIKKSDKDYWPAWIRNNDVYVSASAFENNSQAFAWLKVGDTGEYNVFAKTKAKAEQAAKSKAGYAYEDIAHGDAGYYKHFHPQYMIRIGTTYNYIKYDNHCWFPF